MNFPKCSLQNSKPVREDEVVGLHDLFCSLSGGDDESRDVTLMEQHQGAMVVREKPKRAVQEKIELVKVSDDGKLWRRGR